MMAAKPFIHYIIRSSVGFYWWEQLAAPFLKRKGWDVIEPATFSYESSYGFEPNVILGYNQVSQVEYSLHNATAVVEYHGEPIYDSVFELASNCTVIDDLLAFMSLYTGVYWQYMWKEHRGSTVNWKGSFAMQVSYDRNRPELAGGRDEAFSFFQKALTIIPTLDRTQFVLAIRWFFSALREFEVGRALVEAALNWVCLESQANYLGHQGKSKLEKVKSLLAGQEFPAIPRLEDLHRLRNDAFHDGQLSNLSESDAQAARTAGRALVRAQILNLIGMMHKDFGESFVHLYTT